MASDAESAVAPSSQENYAFLAIGAQTPHQGQRESHPTQLLPAHTHTPLFIHSCTHSLAGTPLCTLLHTHPCMHTLVYTLAHTVT